MNEKVTGRSLGYTCDFCYSYKMTDQLSLGADLSFTTGTISEVKYTSGNDTKSIKLDKENREGLSHLGFSVELRYTF